MKNHKKLLAVTVLSTMLNLAVAATSGGPATPVAPSATAAAPAACALTDPQAFTKKVINQITDVLLVVNAPGANMSTADKVEKIKAVLAPVTDINTMTSFVVPADILAAASVDDRKKFNDTFLNFMVVLYLGALNSYDPKLYEIQVYPLRGVDWTKMDRVQVNTVIINKQNSSGNVIVSFVLAKSGCNWLFQDLSVNNSLSVLSNVQQQIQDIIRQMQSNNKDASQKTIQLSALNDMIAQHNQKNIGN